MKKLKMFGTIKWYKDNKGYGYILGADEETYYFEILDCIKAYKSLTEGEVVKFIPHIGDFDYATEVEKEER